MGTAGNDRRAALVSALTIALAGCTAAPTPGPGGSIPSATASGRPSTAPPPSASQGNPATPGAGPGTPGPTPTGPTPTAWDPSSIRVSFDPFATVPGRPLAIANAGDGSGRLFVAEQGGAVYILEGGDVAPTPFLDVSAQVSGGGEQGLLGLAFHPDFPADNRVFVDYTDRAGDTVVSSFEVDPATPDVVVRGSEAVILTVDQPYPNHNGGTIAFGPDGYLYVALGDGGSGGDPHNYGQRLDTLLGKILRIDADNVAGGQSYGTPRSNPFAGTSGARGEIWLMGLRNPFRFSFDRDTGDLWIGDVGQDAWEEIDVARAGVGGLNFGWRTMEGAQCFSPDTGCVTAGLTLPVVAYPTDSGCAVIGGAVYRGTAFPALRGGYLFSDVCTGITWALDAAGAGQQALVQVSDAAAGVAGYGDDEAGELYAAALDGRVLRVSAIAR